MLTRQPVDIACPANLTPELFEKLADAAKRSHLALGSRDYSLYDFRIHSETQEPYLLESCSFWSFTNPSVLSRMLVADGQILEDVALELWRNAAKRTRVACGSLFKYIKNAALDLEHQMPPQIDLRHPLSVGYLSHPS